MKFTKTLLAAMVLSLSTASYANNPKQQFQQVVEAAKKQDYQTVFRLLQPLAEQGNAAAQTLLGALYDEGKGIKQDDQQAVKWYQKAAEQGFAEAQVRLGLMYGLGRGVTLDKNKTKMWIGKACDNGLQQACEAYRELFKK